MIHLHQTIFRDKQYELLVRNYRLEDYASLQLVQRACFPEPFPQELLWNEEQIANHVGLFPEGAICIEHEGKIIGSITGLLVTHKPGEPHTWEEITDCGYIRTHDPEGDTLYIVDVSVMPAYRALGVGKLLMQAMYYLVVHKHLQRLIGGGRMPGYHKLAETLTAEEYLEKVVSGELYDPVISFLLKCGRRPVQVIANYLEDKESCNYAVLMEWKNPFYSSPTL